PRPVPHRPSRRPGSCPACRGSCCAWCSARSRSCIPKASSPERRGRAMATSNRDPYRFFRIEAAELQDQLGAGILALENGDDAGTLPLLLRLAHTLKGAARVVRQQQIAEHAHALEDILAPLRDRGARAGRAPIDGLLAL